MGHQWIVIGAKAFEVEVVGNIRGDSAMADGAVCHFNWSYVHRMDHATRAPSKLNVSRIQSFMPIWATMAIWAKSNFYAKRATFGLGLFGSLIYYILMICDQQL